MHQYIEIWKCSFTKFALWTLWDARNTTQMEKSNTHYKTHASITDYDVNLQPNTTKYNNLSSFYRQIRTFIFLNLYPLFFFSPIFFFLSIFFSSSCVFLHHHFFFFITTCLFFFIFNFSLHTHKIKKMRKNWREKKNPNPYFFKSIAI
jgi:hypothetical protein